MKRHILLLLCILSLATNVFAQKHIIAGIVNDSVSGEAIIGARIKIDRPSGGTKTISDGTFILRSLQIGLHTITINAIGYQSVTLSMTLSDDSLYLPMILHPLHTEGDEVVVTGTRTTRSIADVPVRVEVIPEEEIQEKIMMEASSVSMALSETPGIRVQTTSATSNSANIRIQGLQGRYTQILVDGIPNLGGLSAGLGITQMPPLNLRQIEIIKGASSVLYGADAIAGVVNFLTKLPQEHEDFSALINVTNQKAQDLAVYYANTINDLGFTLFSSYDHQSIYDVDGDNFSDIAGYSRLNISPQLYYQFSDDVKAKVGFGYMKETRNGGVIDTSSYAHFSPYTEQNISERFYGTAHLEYDISHSSQIAVSAAAMQLMRNAHYGAIPFDGKQTVIYTDFQYSLLLSNHNILVGGAYSADHFSDQTIRTSPSLSYDYSVPGIFIQDEWSVANTFKILGGVRADHHNTYGTFVTPRLSFFYKPIENLTLRIGGGGGYKTPTIFVEESEEIGFHDIRGIPNLRSEDAQSFSFDANWRTVLGPIGITINTALFHTNLKHSLVINEDSIDRHIITLENATGATLTKGAEITTQFLYDKFKLSLGYTYTYATQDHLGVTKEIELNPRHNLGIVLMFEDHENGWRSGLESYYIGSQEIDRNPFRTQTPSYWLFGALLEKIFGQVRIYINFENIFDTKQSNFDPTYIGDPFTSGRFDRLHIYAPLEGRAINGGVRFIL